MDFRLSMSNWQACLLDLKRLLPAPDVLETERRIDWLTQTEVDGLLKDIKCYRDDQEDDLSTISPIEDTKPKYLLKHARSLSLKNKYCINTSGYGLPVIILNALSYFVAIHMHASSNFFSSSFFLCSGQAFLFKAFAIIIRSVECAEYSWSAMMRLNPRIMYKEGGVDTTPSEVFLTVFLEDKTSAPDVFRNFSFIHRAYFETSSAISVSMVTRYDVIRSKWSGNFWVKVHVFSIFFNN